jgi:hypothetical protein
MKSKRFILRYYWNETAISPEDTSSRAAHRFVMILIVMLAILLRLPNLFAGWPYINYIDEGHMIHPLVHMLRNLDWDPHNYQYPNLPRILIGIIAFLAGIQPVPNSGYPSAEPDLIEQFTFYDILQPPSVLLMARVMTLAAGVGVVLLSGRLACRFGGHRAESATALLVALFPSLVIRSAIAAQDMYATCFVLAALLFAWRAGEGTTMWRDTLLAGMACGLAFASKLPTGLVLLPAGLMLLTAPQTFRLKVRSMGLLFLAAGITGTVSSPEFLLQPRKVLVQLRGLSGYMTNLPFPTFFNQAFQHPEPDLPMNYPEIGWPFFIITLLAVISALADRRRRTVVVVWLGYIAGLIGFHSRFTFQPFRYLIPVLPLMCVFVGSLWAKWRSSNRSQRWIADGAMIVLTFSLFGPPLVSYALDRLNCIDARVEAVNWLVMHTQPSDTILVARELTFLPIELKRITANIVLDDLSKAPFPRTDTVFTYVVTGRLTRPDGSEIRPEFQGFPFEEGRLIVRFGKTVTPPDPGFWRGNSETVLIFQPDLRGRAKKRDPLPIPFSLSYIPLDRYLVLFYSVTTNKQPVIQ